MGGLGAACRCRRGFSALEFVTAVVISMILATIAFSGLRLYEQDLPARALAKRINHAFSSARAFAIAQNAIYSVQLDLEHGNFWIDETDGLGNPVVPKVVRPEPFDEKVQIESVLFGLNPADPSQGPIPIRFLPDGSSDDVTIYLKLLEATGDDPRQIQTVRLYGPTGMSKVFENVRLPLAAADGPTT